MAAKFGSKTTAEQVTEDVDLGGKTALITGVNSGIGTETMRVLAMRGAHVIGTARTLEKAQAACDGVQAETTPLACELTDFDSVRACAQSVKDTGKPIDMLICNAGIMALPRLVQKHGLEMQFLTNHVGHFLLVNLLLDQVKAAEAGRIVMVSSAAHKTAPLAGIRFDNLSGEKMYQGWIAYGQSKLANVLFARELARRLADTRVTANSLHPGVIKTNLSRSMEGLLSAAIGLLPGVFYKSVAQGAATTCYVATRPELAGVSGEYFSDCRKARSSMRARNDELATRLWERTEEILEGQLG